MNRAKFCFLVASTPLLWLLFTSVANAQLTARVDRNEVKIAEPFELIVTATVPQDTPVEFPQVEDSIGPFAVISHNEMFDIPIESGRRWTRTYELEAYESGGLQIPPMTVLVGKVPVESEAIDVVVQSLLDGTSDPTKFRELKDIEDIVEDESSSLSWIIGGIFTAALIVGFILMSRRRKKVVSPDQWAYGQIEQLQESTAFKAKDQTTVLPAAADILREYIRRRFHIAAPQQTTQEFLNRIQNDPVLDKEQREDLQRFLQQIDKIKFAHLVPATDQLNETLQRVRVFIERSAQDDRQFRSKSEAA